MDIVGSEIGQKMRSAIKAKLTELGCYVDDELPDYVMVMVANKRTRGQMEDDLQLFLGDNTELFVNWLHQVLKKLQEVTVTAPTKAVETEKSKEKSQSKDAKSKDKKSKEKIKKSDLKKAKKKDKEKEKLNKKKEEKKSHKKKKSKHHEMIRPNIPPLLMNLEKDSEPSITDAFAGQILKNHGISLDTLVDNSKEVEDKKINIQEMKRPIIPIIDPATINSQSEPSEYSENSQEPISENSQEPISGNTHKNQHIKEMKDIQNKIDLLKEKLSIQLDSMSEDEDFLNIGTEAEELMNDFAEDVFQEVSQQVPVKTFAEVSKAIPVEVINCPTPPPPIPKVIDFPVPIEISKTPYPETLPQIELKLPKRPVRERLGARQEIQKVPEVKQIEEKKDPESPERYTPEREPETWSQKSAKTRPRHTNEPQRRQSVTEEPKSHEKSETSKRLTSKVSALEGRAACASVVRVRPRPRVPAPASSLLLRAVADAHKSLLNIPPKIEKNEHHDIKRALVKPIRRCIDAKNIVIQVSGNVESGQYSEERHGPTGPNESGGMENSKFHRNPDKDEYIPIPITKRIINNEYTPSRRFQNQEHAYDEPNILENINIHNPAKNKDEKTQFIVTMDGYHPNAFLAKKLLTEGLLNDDEDDVPKKQDTIVENTKEIYIPKEKTVGTKEIETTLDSVEEKVPEPQQTPDINIISKKRLSNTSEDSNTEVIIKKEEDRKQKRKSVEEVEEKSVPVKRRKSSPIVFDVEKKSKDKERARTESASSDNAVTVTTIPNSHKYDSVPPLLAAERKQTWCRAFPLCRYGAACAFTHPRCRFAGACTRRGCVYAHAHPHPAAPSVASHVVPAANYKSISATPLPSICKYYPQCVNPACGFLHPKPCRYGKHCTNKLECNFYHADVTTDAWRHII